VPTPVVEVVVAARRRRAVPIVMLGGRAGDDEDPQPVSLVDGEPIPEHWRPAATLRGKPGETHALTDERWLAGVGDATRPRDWRTAGGAIARAVDGFIASRSEAGQRPAQSLQLELPDDLTADCLAAFVLGLRLGGHAYKVSEQPPPARLRSVTLLTSPRRREERVEIVREAGELAAATGLARDLANTPSNVKNPAWLARTAQRVADGVAGLRATVRDKAWLQDNGFGGLLAVGGGSASEPRLIELAHRPRGATRSPPASRYRRGSGR
jgi:leucyl aminopeptidase